MSLESEPREPSTSSLDERGRPWIVLTLVGCGSVFVLTLVVIGIVFSISWLASGIDNGTVSETTPPEPTPTSVANSSQQQVPTPIPYAGVDSTPELPEPIPSPTVNVDPADLSVEFGQWYWDYAGEGGIVVFGELWNHSSVPVDQVEIVLQLVDDEEQVLEDGIAQMHMSMIDSGDVTPFTYLFSEAGDDFTSIRIEADVREYVPDENLPFRRHFELDVIDHEWTVANDQPQIRGFVTNQGEEIAELIMVLVAGYDDEGTLRFVEWTFADSDQLEPGEESEFAMPWITWEPDPTMDLRFFTQGWVAN